MNKQSSWLLGSGDEPIKNDFGDDVALADHKIAFAVEYCKGKDVLDIGCVQHNPENYRSRFWLHRALKETATSVLGIDLYAPGVEYLKERGFNVAVGDAEDFDLRRTFDVIVAGDLIEHLGNIGGFLASCRRHLNHDGKLLISTPNPWYWRNIVKAMLFARVSNNPEHTVWLCPVVLGQLAERYGFEVESVKFGSRYIRDRALPLPRGIKHTSFHAVLRTV